MSTTPIIHFTTVSQFARNTAAPVCRRFIAFLIFIFLVNFAHAQQQPVFYFAAHEDDWQLFMGSNAFSDSRSNAKIVFVTLTAGDAGCGSGCPGTTSYQVPSCGLVPGTTSNPVPYFVAREQGSIATVKFMGDYQTSQSSLQIRDICENPVTINGHTIQKVVYRNMVAYFFRLPDGNPSGSGYPDTGLESLRNSRDHINPTLMAVDGSTTFVDWNDFTATIRTIVLQEAGSARYAWINLPSTDRAYNPDDHSDHYNTSFAAQDAMRDYSQFGFNGFMDYHTDTQLVNLHLEQIEDKAALFGTINYELYFYGAFSTWEPHHKAWLGREYSQVIRYPAPLLTQLQLPPLTRRLIFPAINPLSPLALPILQTQNRP